jgi:hypothetical protein
LQLVIEDQNEPHVKIFQDVLASFKNRFKVEDEFVGAALLDPLQISLNICNDILMDQRKTASAFLYDLILKYDVTTWKQPCVDDSDENSQQLQGQNSFPSGSKEARNFPALSKRKQSDVTRQHVGLFCFYFCCMVFFFN